MSGGRFTTFCRIVRLRVGVAIVSTVFFTICGIILVRNDFDFYTPEDLQPLLPIPVNLAVIITFVLGLLVVATRAFSSSFQTSPCAAIVGLVMLGFTLLFWITVYLVSIIGNPKIGISLIQKTFTSFKLLLLYR